MPIIGTLVHGNTSIQSNSCLFPKKNQEQDGVSDAVAIMATHENKAILKATEMCYLSLPQRWKLISA